MKLTMTRVLTPLAALAFTLGAQAKVESSDGFESYTAGDSVTNAVGWSFTAGGDGAPDASVVTAYAGATTPSVLPDGTTAGDNFLKLSTEDGILFRNMNGKDPDNNVVGSVDLYKGLYVDTDVQFTLTDSSDRPTPDGADKFIIWLEADENAGATNLCVWAREYKAENDALVANSNKVYKLNASSIVPGEWHRLTVKAIAQIDTTTTIPGFQVYLDNTLLASNDSMFPSDQAEYAACYALASATARGLADAGTFFPAMANSLSALSQVGFSGEGAIDNLVVTRDLPGFTEPTTVRFDFDTDVIDSIDIDELGVVLTSTNDTISVAPDATFTFAITWKSGYSAPMFNIATSASGYANVSDYTVTADGFGLGVITVATSAKDTTDVSFDWEAIGTALGDDVADFTGISFTIGGDTYTPASLEDTPYTINGVKTGTNITVNVTFANNKWVGTIPTMPECMSLNGMTLTLDTRPSSGAATVYVSAEAAPSPVTVDGVGYDTLSEALAAASTAGKTVVLNTDLTGEGAISTAAATIDLNGHKLGTTGITFTGTGAKTLKGGDVVDSYNTITITAPAGENLTFDGVTFHASVTPAGSGDVLLVTNCTFLCDKDTSGNDFVSGSGATVHSYGILFAASSQFAQADIVNNWFAQGRRAAVQASFANDLYFYGNTVDATANTCATGSGNEGLDARYPALQIFSNGRVFIENNTFFGQYLGEAFCIYNKGTYRSTGAAVVFNGNVVSNDVNYLWGIYDADKSGSAALVDPDLYFGANTVGANVDTEHCVYKAVVDGVDMNGVTYSHTPATLALPTGVATVYDWTHGTHADQMYVTPSGEGVAGFVNDLSEVKAGDTVTAVPGDVPVKANYTFTPGALKNQFTAALASYTITYMYDGSALSGLTPATYTVEDAVTLPTEVDLGVVGVGFTAWTNAEGTVVSAWPAGGLTGNQTFYAQVTAVVPPSGETIEPGQQSTTTYNSQAEAEAALANVTIAASDAVTNALDAAAQATYLMNFEKKVVEVGETGTYKIEVGLTAEAAATLQSTADTAVTTAAGSLAAAATADQTVEVDAVAGFYYSVASGTEVGSLTEGARTLATGNKVNLTLPTKGAKGFYRVLVNIADVPAPTPNSGD